MIINPQATKIKKTKSVPPPTSRTNFHLQSETHLPASLGQPNCALLKAQPLMQQKTWPHQTTF